MLREGGCLSPFGEKKRKEEERKVFLKLISLYYYMRKINENI